jgi:NDP-4-keto-2,6-dideoxyhexose 3-C-methyltransferase
VIFAMYRATDRGRACGNAQLELIIDLGEQALTGVFPRSRDQAITAGPLRLLKCHGADACGLVQLAHSYEATDMYGANYGYRSGLNASMVAHLRGKVERILGQTKLEAGDVVLDIGSNDGTTLSAYPAHVARVGIDPTAEKFRRYYPADVTVVADFFSRRTFQAAVGEKKAKVVTAFSMFYDLERPLDFMTEVHQVLAADGIWVFEQSYLPLMLERNSYDTICHEHLEYYTVAQVDWMARRTGFKIVDVELNDVNGGSFSVTVAKSDSARAESPAVRELIERERAAGLDGLKAYEEFAERVRASRAALLDFVREALAAGKTIAGLGASTKGNVLLQYSGLGPQEISAIGDVNEDKFGAFTPGTGIPIQPEQEVIERAPDYLLVLPWHFRQTFLRKTLKGGSRLVFPLPRLEVV